MTATFDDVYTEIGRLEEFNRQLRINEEHGLKHNGPVYKSWLPSDRPPTSSNLNSVSTLHLLRRAISIVAMYMVVTVRQVYYVLVSSQDVYNNQNEYERIGRIIKNARLAGLISFDKIIDDTREAEKTTSWGSMEEIIRTAIDQYRSDWWRGQEYYVEVWLEKRALRRVFFPITDSYDVHLCPAGGYASWSEIFQANVRSRRNKGKKCVLLYFGDLDPSGKDMPRDIKDRLSLMGIGVEVVEVALTQKDIIDYRLPRNPSKDTDSRKQWYVEKYGIDYAVELDALPPRVLADKIRTSIEAYCDIELLNSYKNRDMVEKTFWRKWIETDK